MDTRSGAPPYTAVIHADDQVRTWRFAVIPGDPAVPRIRYAVHDLIRRQQAPLSADRLYEALLILSELVTNAVRHAALLTPEIGVEVALDDHRVRLSVEDGHPYRPNALQPQPEQERTGGRGLLLVQATALEAGGTCGIEPTASGGKVIWAELPLDRVPACGLTSRPRSPSHP